MNGNPILFSRTFDLIYYFHKTQILTFEIIEISKEKTEIYKKDIPLSKIISFGNSEKNFLITNFDSFSFNEKLNYNLNSLEKEIIKFNLKIDWFIIEDRETILQLKIYKIKFYEEKKILKNEERFFFVISNKLDGKNFRHFFKTEEIEYQKGKEFDSLEINSQEFCLNNLKKEVKIDFYKFEEKNENNNNNIKEEKAFAFGFIEKKFNELISSLKKIPIYGYNNHNHNHNLNNNYYVNYNLNTNKNPNKDYEKDIKDINNKITLNTLNEIGECKLTISLESRIYQKEFLELIKKYKLSINLSIAIDFTYSNGDPLMETSLHYININKNIENKKEKEKEYLNPYKKAIKSIVKIIGEYDEDKKFPVYGFGAKINNEEYVSHDFNINLNKEDPNIYGIDNILKNYENIFEHIIPFGPTIISVILEKVLIRLQKENLKIWDNKKQQKFLNYDILLILTDGAIDDIPETIDLIVKMSFYPISIIIVGIGEDKDFSNMEILGKFFIFYLII
jgi:hypothetical protein